MTAIRDFTWLKHLRTGTVLERFTMEDFRAVALKIPASKMPMDQYRYRMLFFSPSEEQPVLSLNMERSILGSYCLTEQWGDRHLRHDTVEDSLSYDDFRSWAVNRAMEELHGNPTERLN